MVNPTGSATILTIP